MSKKKKIEKIYIPGMYVDFVFRTYRCACRYIFLRTSRTYAYGQHYANTFYIMFIQSSNSGDNKLCTHSVVPAPPRRWHFIFPLCISRPPTDQEREREKERK